MHDLTVIVNLAAALAAALVLGWLSQKLGLSSLVGFMVAGIVVGPHTPGFVADAALAQQMAEIGVILLMFTVGMHFHPRDLLRVRRVAVPGAVAQSLVAGVAGWAAARFAGWSHGAGIVFGIALSVASTVVLMRMLVQHDRLGSRHGHVAIGWLIVEDLFTVVALVVLPVLAAQHGSPVDGAIGIAAALGKAALFALLIWALGARFLAPTMERIARMRSAELFTLTVFVVALGLAILASEVFQMSVALGAFLAGLVVGQSRIGPQAAADMAPFRDVFSALFFVSIGMLFDPGLMLEKPGLLAMALAIILVLKPLAALFIVLALRDTVRTGLTVSVGLAQIGEFSFIVAGLGVALGLLPVEGRDVLVAAALVSIAVNPLLFRWLPRLEGRLAERPAPAEELARGEDTSPQGAPLVVVSGLGGLGRGVVTRCASQGIELCVIDHQLDELEKVRAAGVATVFGDPGRVDVLDAACAQSARALVVTNASLPEKMRICTAARRLNPRIVIIVSAESEAERAWLREFGAAFVIDSTEEVGEALVRALRGVL